MKFNTFGTKEYTVHVDTMYGVWSIIRKKTGESTLWNTGSEGYEDYKKLKKLFHRNKTLFNRFCDDARFK